jgi:hypothetical protein
MRPAGWALARCCLAGAATFVAVVAAYQIPYEYSIDIGRLTDAPFVEALWLNGGDYYDSDSLQAFRSSSTDSEIVNFTNPPSAAALYAPLALLPFPQAREVWILLNFALLGVTGVLLWLGRRRSSTPPSILLLVLVLSTDLKHYAGPVVGTSV